jgi:hypothetical protein
MAEPRASPPPVSPFEEVCRDRLTPSRRYEAGAGGVRGMLTTVLGEFARRTGQPTPSSALIDVLGRFGVEEKTSRQTLLRASKDGWFTPVRVGRQTLWQLSPAFETFLNRGEETATPTATATPSSGPRPVHSMGFIGCSMAENTAQGYVADGGTRMWGPYGTGGLVVQSWTDPNSSAWRLFDQQVARFGRPTAVWVQICVFTNGATYNEVKQLIANARQHAAAGATIYITGQPQYDAGHVCSLAGAIGPQLTDNLAKQAGADASQNVLYAGQFHLANNEVVSDGCHANPTGQASLGRQALAFWS